MFGNNPKRPPEKGIGDKLQVQEIFYTLQGEGPYAGWPAVFIRLGGCNLACTFCDTEFESFSLLSLEDIEKQVQESIVHYRQGAKGRLPLIVITGGEPFRQPIEPLCLRLLALGYAVQIETNGTLYRPLPEGVSIICSPKATQGRYHLVHRDLVPHITAFKYLISATLSPYQEVPSVVLANPEIPVYVQPMDEYNDEKNRKNTMIATEVALRYGYRLSLQQHKILHLP